MERGRALLRGDTVSTEIRFPRRGRPPRSSAGPSSNVTVRFADPEREALQRLADRNGETLSALVRRFTLERQRELFQEE